MIVYMAEAYNSLKLLSWWQTDLPKNNLRQWKISCKLFLHMSTGEGVNVFAKVGLYYAYNNNKRMTI